MKAVRASDLGGRGGNLTGGEKPVELVFFDRFGKPVQQQARAAGERDLVERNAERELEDAGWHGCDSAFSNETEKRALNFAAAFGHILRNDEQPRVAG